MSKLVGHLINEIEESDLIGDDFKMFVLTVKISESGEITSNESIEPIERIGFDIENEECLLEISENDTAIEVSEAFSEIAAIDSRFTLVAAHERSFDDSWVRIDKSIIGFGENIGKKQFFVVCTA